jgi:alkanesulfonate monooxygenase SsuD/methylene tetrahydromethanopterin reductase-like flavin-dependent oxidoreductase (luciferase family)
VTPANLPDPGSGAGGSVAAGTGASASGPQVGIGVQLALQGVAPADVVGTAVAAERLGVGLVSVWDHLYGLQGQPANLEVTTMLTAVAVATERVRVASLVHAVTLRHPAVIAAATATLDHLSGGRVELGLGAGYLASEHDDHGIPLGPPAERADRLEESARAVQALLAGGPVDLDGRHVRLRGAVCEPRPLQDPVPLWIGGGGERRTIPLAARIADGWNIPSVTLPDLERKLAVLRAEEEAAGRPAGTVRTSVNLPLAWTDDDLRLRFGPAATDRREVALCGSTGEVTDRAARYVEVGTDLLVLSLRAPFDVDGLARFVEEVVPALPRAARSS